MAKEHSKSFYTAVKTLRAAMSILKKNGGEMTSRQLMDEVGKSLEFTPWELETTTNGNIYLQFWGIEWFQQPCSARHLIALMASG